MAEAGTRPGDFVHTPDPPYYAVIFAARLRDVELADYFQGSCDLMAKAKKLPGFIGEDAVRTEDGRAITVSYWRDHESIVEWSRDADHVVLKRRGRRDFYDCFELRIARVERALSFHSRPA